MTIRRFSSRTESLDKAFLAKVLEGATKYFRIAGYFRSSIFELVGEEIAKIPEVKIVCNSELDLLDFQVATARDTALKEHWNEVDVEAEAVLHKERYRRLDALLKAGNVEIRVVPRERLFLHGKAGSVHYLDGSRKSFMGSVNDSKSAFAHNYELVWQDENPEAADWVEAEFWALWKEGVPLPDAILKEIDRVAQRREVTVEVLKPEELPGAAMAEAPIYRGGEQLQPWQRSFVTLFLEHREIYGKARLLLADEVGVGKTLSMAGSALVSALVDDGPVLILAPSTLTIQWQVELKDKLGIPSAVWSSQKKVWLGPEGQQLSSRGDAKAIRKCPHQIAIVSTGIIMHQRDGRDFIKEAGHLMGNKYGCVILDEAHKARVRGGVGSQATEPNNLLAFMREIGKKTHHLILGTATPIQTKVSELWELMGILNSGVDFVMGDPLSPWGNMDEAIELVTGNEDPRTAEHVWRWLRNPLPPAQDSIIVKNIRDELGIRPTAFDSSHDFPDLDYFVQKELEAALGERFFQKHNPLLRHIVLRKRSELEDAGLLERVGVNTHPMRDRQDLYESRFVGLGIPTNRPFEVAYEKAEEFSSLLNARTKGAAGFMKSLMLQRICSSFASGRRTAEKMLKHVMPEDGRDDLIAADEHLLAEMGSGEVACLNEIVNQLSRPEAVDSKLDMVKWFLTQFRSEGKSWLQHGCIVFSQYYDTAEWVASELATVLENEVVAVYAGVGKSGLFKGKEFSKVEREVIKAAVKKREIRLVIATDAACEGLNLQTLGTLINVDLPWNPSRLEQRLGRIKRFGQTRKYVDMLNLVYSGTQDERVYNVLSDRLKDTYDIFGSLPDTIDDEWIEDENTLRARMDEYIHERERTQNAFSVRYKATVDPDANKWEYCTEVLSRRDIINTLSKPWK